MVAVRYFEGAFGAIEWFPFAITVLGVAGVAVAPRRQVRVLLSAVVGALIVAFVLFRNEAYAVIDPNQVSDYWGILLVPLLAACMPVAFALVPGMRRYQGDEPPVEDGSAMEGEPEDSGAD
jgi:hypothetical protein